MTLSERLSALGFSDEYLRGRLSLGRCAGRYVTSPTERERCGEMSEAEEANDQSRQQLGGSHGGIRSRWR